jgi:2-oxoglutarate/2-oxoacid ferredoxin oxidoreductase subunit alpha
MADQVPEMAHAGEGYRFHVTGLTHDERGYPVHDGAETQDRLVRRLFRRFGPVAARGALRDSKRLTMPMSWWCLTESPRGWRKKPSRWRARKACETGKFRLISAWPFPAGPLAELTRHAKAFVVPELNLGQMVHEEVGQALSLRRPPGKQPAASSP